jgi:hypothetical protein
MTPYTVDREELRQYLLGNVSQEARQGIEERLLIENSFFEELLLIEEELIDDYVGGELSGDDRSRFERHFLSTPERHQKLRFALALNRYTAEHAGAEPTKAQPQGSPATPSLAERFRAFWNRRGMRLRAAGALATVVIVVGALWLFLPRTRSPRTFATLNLNITISNNRAEGAQAAKVNLPLNADALKISLRLPDEAPTVSRYDVELLAENGATAPLDVAEQDARSVTVVIPAARLARGQYALKLFTNNASGARERVSGSYFFTVE